MTPPFRQGEIPRSISDSTVGSGNQTSVSSITVHEDMIKSLQLQIKMLTNKQNSSYVYNMRHYKPDKIKDAAVINDLIFYISTMIFRRYKFLSNKAELYNYQKKGTIGYVMMSDKCLNIVEDEKEEFWFKYARKVSSIITDKRSASRTCMKKEFIGKLSDIHIMFTVLM